MNCLSHSIQRGNQNVAVAIAAITFATAALLLSGCNEAADADDAPYQTSSAQVSGNTVELSGDQLNVIKIAPVGTYLFPVEEEAVGTVFFDEDPNTVQAESTLIGAAAAEVAATNVLARAQTLYDTNGVSKAELEQDIAAEEIDRAALRAGRDAVRALGQTDCEIDQMIAAAGIGTAQGVHTPPKWVQANVAENDCPMVQVGQRVKVQVTPFPNQVFDGTVSKVYSTVDQNSHRMAVRCEVSDPDNKLRVGMLATILIAVSKPLEATALPDNGVVRDGDGTMTAWVTTDRRHFTQRIIKTGMREDGAVQILDGLHSGELVVTDGAVFIDNILFAPQTE